MKSKSQSEIGSAFGLIGVGQQRFYSIETRWTRT